MKQEFVLIVQLPLNVQLGYAGMWMKWMRVDPPAPNSHGKKKKVKGIIILDGNPSPHIWAV